MFLDIICETSCIDHCVGSVYGLPWSDAVCVSVSDNSDVSRCRAVLWNWIPCNQHHTQWHLRQPVQTSRTVVCVTCAMLLIYLMRDVS